MLDDSQVAAAVLPFVPTVTATADEVAEAIERATAEAASGKPVLAVVLSAAGIPAALRRDGAHVAAFHYRSRQRARSAGWLNARSGCASRTARSRRSTASNARRLTASSDARSRTATTSG